MSGGQLLLVASKGKYTLRGLLAQATFTAKMYHDICVQHDMKFSGNNAPYFS